MSWTTLWLLLVFVAAYTFGSIIHELAHWYFFRRYKLPIVELSFGILRFTDVENRFTLTWTLSRPFDFHCSCKGLREISSRKREICLLSGGVVNLASAIIPAICLIWATEDNTRLFLIVIVAACVANACATIFNPYSADRTLLRELNQQEKNKR
jgi:hypothetical protein